MKKINWKEFNKLEKNDPKRLTEKNWDKHVNAAKPMVSLHMNGQVEIAKHAMLACEALEHRRKKYKTEFTPKKFAETIGLNPKTLYEWIAVTRNIVMRLPENKYKKTDYAVAYRVHRKVTLENTKEEVLAAFEEETNKGPYAYYLEQLIKSCRTGYRFINKRRKSLPIKELRHLRIYTHHMTVLLNSIIEDEVIGEVKEKEQTNRTTKEFTYTKGKSYDGDDLKTRKGRESKNDNETATVKQTRTKFDF